MRREKRARGFFLLSRKTVEKIAKKKKGTKKNLHHPKKTKRKKKNSFSSFPSYHLFSLPLSRIAPRLALNSLPPSSVPSLSGSQELERIP